MLECDSVLYFFIFFKISIMNSDCLIIFLMEYFNKYFYELNNKALKCELEKNPCGTSCDTFQA